jgi:hypothetical protein
MDIEGFGAWLERYFQAWVSNQPADVGGLFTEDADYWVGPFTEPRRGRGAIVEWWVNGVKMDVEFAYEPLAVNGDIGVAHWNVKSRNGAGLPREWDGVLQITFAPDGRCREHREWFSVRDLQD